LLNGILNETENIEWKTWEKSLTRNFLEKKSCIEFLDKVVAFKYILVLFMRLSSNYFPEKITNAFAP